MTTPVDTYIEELAKTKSWLAERVDLGINPLKEELKRCIEFVEKARKDLDEWRRSKLSRLSNDGRFIVTEGKYAGLDLMELAIVQNLMQARVGPRPNLVRPEALQELAEAKKSIRDALTHDAFFAWEERALKAKETMIGYPTAGAAKFRDSLVGWRSQMFQQWRKALDSATAGSGDELVPTMEAAELWMDVNLETKVLPLFTQFPMPTNPFDIPAQFGDVNWYPTAENEQGTTTTVATAKATLTAYELKAGIPFSDTLDEDSIVALVPELRRQLAMNAAEVIDDVLLNGDTTATNGVNSDGATIAKSTAGKAHWLLGFDGLIHLPIIDNTAQRTAHSSTITAALYNLNLVKLARHAIPGRRGDVVHISDINTYVKALTIDEVETVDKFGPRATISSGELASVYGVPYIVSEQMKLADADGKVTDSGGNSTGRVLTVNVTQWRTGFRRQITFEADREVGKSQTVLYVSFRIAFTERTGTRSSAKHTAIQYDISSVT